MENEKKTEEANQADSPNLLEETQKKIEALKAENDRMSANIARLEKIRSHEMLAGKAEAGKPKPQEESAKDYAARIMRGGK